MLERYFRLSETADKMVAGGMNGLDPIIRSIYRKLWKIWKSLSEEERRAADFRDEIWFR